MKEILYPFKEFLNEAKVPPIPKLRAPDPLPPADPSAPDMVGRKVSDQFDDPYRRGKPSTMKIDQVKGESDAETRKAASELVNRLVKSDIDPNSHIGKGIMRKLSGNQQLGLEFAKQTKELSPRLQAKLIDFQAHAPTIDQRDQSDTIQDFSPSEKGRGTQPQGSRTLNDAPVYAKTLDMKEVIEEANRLIDSLINE